MAGIKSLAKDTVIYGLSSIIGRFLNWCLVPLYTIMFPADEYGVVAYLYAVVAVTLIILTYGMETGFFRFANHEDYNDPMKVYSTSLISLASTSTIFTVLVIFAAPWLTRIMDIGNHSDYIILLAITVAIDAFTAIPFSYLRYSKKPFRFAIIRLVSIAINIGLNLFFILLCPKLWEICPDAISCFYDPSYGIGYIFVSNLVSSAVTLLLLIPQLIGFTYRFDGKLLRRMLKYSAPLLVLGIAGIMNQTLGQLMLPDLVGEGEDGMAQLGIYSANYKIAIVMVMFIQAFRFAYEPFIFAQNKEEGTEGKLKSYSDAMKYFIIFAIVIFLSVMFFLPILKYFIGSNYFSGLVVVPVVMIAELFFGIFFNLSLWYKLTDQTQWGMYFSLFGLAITIGVNVLLVPHIGYMGCAIAAFCCYGAMMIASYIIGQKKYPIHYDLRNAAFYTILGAVFYAVGMLLPINTEWILLTFRALILAIFIYIILHREPIPLPGRLKNL